MLISKINCRYNHTFIDEDCIGVAKGLARRCHRKLLEVRVLGRFLLRVKTLRHRTNVPVRSARAVIRKMILSTWSWEHLPPKVHIWNFVLYDFLGLYECRLQMPTELSYKPMLFPEPTFVNVDTICIRWILWDIYIYIINIHKYIHIARERESFSPKKSPIWGWLSWNPTDRPQGEWWRADASEGSLEWCLLRIGIHISYIYNDMYMYVYIYIYHIYIYIYIYIYSKHSFFQLNGSWQKKRDDFVDYRWL